MLNKNILNMKSKIFTGLCLFLLVSLLMSCENQQLNFSESQPTKSKEHKRFKKGFTGEYLSLDDSVSVLYVSKNRIIRHNKFRTKIHLTELDTMKNVSIQGDKLVVKEAGIDEQIWDLEWEEDSAIILATFSVDTLFELSSDNVLKYDRKKYFLNKKVKNNLWNVDILMLDENDQLTICGLSGEEAVLEDIKNIFPVSAKMDLDQNGTSDYIQRISKKEFRALLELDAVYIRGEYQKMK